MMHYMQGHLGRKFTSEDKVETDLNAFRHGNERRSTNGRLVLCFSGKYLDECTVVD